MNSALEIDAAVRMLASHRGWKNYGSDFCYWFWSKKWWLTANCYAAPLVLDPDGNYCGNANEFGGKQVEVVFNLVTYRKVCVDLIGVEIQRHVKAELVAVQLFRQ